MLNEEPGGPVPPVVRSPDPHNLGDAARLALGGQLWELRTLSSAHPHPPVRQAASAVAAIPIDGKRGLVKTSEGSTCYFQAVKPLREPVIQICCSHNLLLLTLSPKHDESGSPVCLKSQSCNVYLQC